MKDRNLERKRFKSPQKKKYKFLIVNFLSNNNKYKKKLSCWRKNSIQ